MDDDLETRSTWRREREADRFAGALLVDPSSAANVVGRWPDDRDAAIAEIVSEFEVSVPTSAIALEQLGLTTRKELDAFLREYQASDHRRFMERHGLLSRHSPGSGRLVHDPAFKTRVAYLLARGQLSPDRAAGLLGSAVEDLPKGALAAYKRLAAAVMSEPEFD